MISENLILVVDDSEDNRLLLERILKRAGYQTCSAKDGQEAINFIVTCGGDIDLVLLDWMMPGLSGIDVLRSIRERSDQDELPIIMCTARGEEDCVAAALAEGANDYLTKPIQKEVLLARVRGQISRKEAFFLRNRLARQLEKQLSERTLALAELSRRQNQSLGPTIAALEAIVSARSDCEIEAAKQLADTALATLLPPSKSERVG